MAIKSYSGNDIKVRPYLLNATVRRYANSQNIAHQYMQNGDDLFVKYSNHGFRHVYHVVNKTNEFCRNMNACLPVECMIKYTALLHDIGMNGGGHFIHNNNGETIKEATLYDSSLAFQAKDCRSNLIL